ncbi:hypothetical protein BLOT_009331 [Blomia tropicalis]|nr:hypothetical protein BLOT_009331 [Blomia tropicalis]
MRRLITLTDKKKIILRKRPAVIHVPYFSLLRNPTDYCYSMLMQFIPFRSENELIKGFGDEILAFDAKKDQLKDATNYMKQYYQIGSELEDALRQLNAFDLIDPNRDSAEQ